VACSAGTLRAGDRQAAQQAAAPVPAQEKPQTSLVPLRIQIVLSRTLGDKKTSSLPYMLGVLANGPKTSLRMGVDVPVAASRGVTESFSYRGVGTNIDCHAEQSAGGTYKLTVTVSDSSLHVDSPPAAQTSPEKGLILSGLPAFRSFNTTFTVLLRDGQTVQHTSATDPVSGEVMRIDVTLNVVK
jgi:hypothetical protein